MNAMADNSPPVIEIADTNPMADNSPPVIERNGIADTNPIRDVVPANSKAFCGMVPGTGT